MWAFLPSWSPSSSFFPSSLPSLLTSSFLHSLLILSCLVYLLLPPSLPVSCGTCQTSYILVFLSVSIGNSFYTASSEIASVSFWLLPEGLWILLFLIASCSLAFLMHNSVLCLLDVLSQICYWLCPLTNFYYFYFPNFFCFCFKTIQSFLVFSLVVIRIFFFFLQTLAKYTFRFHIW